MMNALIAACALTLSANLGGAAETYYRASLGDLELVGGSLPDDAVAIGSRWRRAEAFEPYAILDGSGEAYLRQTGNGLRLPQLQMVIRAAGANRPKGTLYVPNNDVSGMLALKFSLATNRAAIISSNDFLLAKREHYASLATRQIPGAGWFRHQAGITQDERFRRAQFDAISDLESTFELFTGGRAISENLQLDRALRANGWGESTVEITNLSGIMIREMNWEPLVKNLKPKADFLAAFVPADQHAIFFPSFTAMTDMADEADWHGTPLLRWIEPRSEDAHTRERYEKQLCLELNQISRLLGPKVIGSIGLTGSDPYLRTGSDIGVLFEAKSPGVLKSYLTARHAEVKRTEPAAQLVRGEIDDVAYQALMTRDRLICSYVALAGDVVYVCNSLEQLRGLIEVAKGKRQALASAPEYTFFRHRYAADEADEAALLVLTDATIRRWCGPRWRIGNSRRTRMAAYLSELQATHLDALVQGDVANTPLTNQRRPEAGEVQLTSAGVASSIYGTLDFLTPIAELPLSKVTKQEADAYEQWRNGYQNNWQQFFDPIAIRVGQNARQLKAEITVMPLIARSDYNDLLRLTTGAEIKAGTGDPHSGALAHLAVSINAQSEMFKKAGGFLSSMNPAWRANPLGWLGQSIAVYADQDPFWDKLHRDEADDGFLSRSLKQLPVALHCEVKSALGVAGFLSALRAYVEQTAPQITRWHNLNYKDQAYVKVTSAERFGSAELTNTAVYYAVTSKSLVLTLNEALLKRALDRQAGRTNNQAAAGSQPWLGTNLCLQVDQQFLGTLASVFGDNYEASQQKLCWDNLPILNEWKRRYPAHDPVKLHEKFWQARLVCPGGGAYVWNDRWHTMESTVHGHPGEPRKAAAKVLPLQTFRSANLGLNFENEGLSATIQVERVRKNTAAEFKKVAVKRP